MRKRKIAILTACAAAAISLCAVTALAVSGNSAENLVKMTENAIAYSADGGETWSEQLPEDAAFSTEIFEDGEAVIWQGKYRPFMECPECSAKIEFEFPKHSFGIKDSMTVRVEDGVTMFSEDGGETWTEEIPDGIEIFPDGIVKRVRRGPFYSGDNSADSFIVADAGMVI